MSRTLVDVAIPLLIVPGAAVCHEMEVVSGVTEDWRCWWIAVRFVAQAQFCWR